jgi:hypothetical protein
MQFYRVSLEELILHFAETKAEAHRFAKTVNKTDWLDVFIDMIEVPTSKQALLHLLTSAFAHGEPPHYEIITTYRLSSRGALKEDADGKGSDD